MDKSGAAAMPDKPRKPSLHVSFDSYGPASDAKFDKEQMKSCKQEIDAIKGELKDWNPVTIAALAKKSLERELRVKEARLEELKARMDSDMSISDAIDESYDEDDAEGE